MNVLKRRWLGTLIVQPHLAILSSRRLREITQETEHEQRRRIAEMEKDVTSLDDIQSMSPQASQTVMWLTLQHSAIRIYSR